MQAGDPRVGVSRLGVIGGGTMGSGIAQLAAFAGLDTVLVDPHEDALAAARARIDEGLRKSATRAGLSEADVTAALGRLTFAAAIEAVGGCDFVIEAVPEELTLKQSVLQAVAEACNEKAVIATNTSSLSVTLLARGLERPERVVGTHFFNPPVVMKLVEVIPGLDTSQETVSTAVALCASLGKQPLLVSDTPGFLVNRCARPFYGEALRLLQEGISHPAQIDRICRLGGGFRMGPFELMDLIGNDVGLAATATFQKQSFGEPRWRPSPLQQQLVAGGRLGRKTGRGWFTYGSDPHREPDPPAPEAQPGAGSTASVTGSSRRAVQVRAALGGDKSHVSTRVAIVCDGSLPKGSQLLVLSCANRSLASWRRPDAVGFNLLPASGAAAVVELTRGESSDEDAATIQELFEAHGIHVEWVGDAPGLVLGRIAAQLINEACFAVGEGVSEAAGVDAAMKLGLNFPRGPLEWAAEIGWAEVLRTLDGLWSERREERYRPAPLLQRLAWREADA